MHDNMVERVASALRRNKAFCAMADDAGCDPAAMDYRAKEIARAAIEAMLELPNK